MLFPQMGRKMVREAIKNPRITVEELQRLVASWGPGGGGRKLTSDIDMNTL